MNKRQQLEQQLIENINDYYYKRKFQKLRMAIEEVLRIRHKLKYYPKKVYNN